MVGVVKKDVISGEIAQQVYQMAISHLFFEGTDRTEVYFFLNVNRFKMQFVAKRLKVQLVKY